MTASATPGRRALTGAALLTIIAGYAWISYHYLLVVYLDGSDAWAHFTAIRRTLEEGPFAGDLFFADEPATSSYYSLSHLLFALVARVTGLEAHSVFAGAGPFVAALDILAVFLWLRTLTGDRRVAVAGAAVELMLNATAPAWRILGAPRNVALLPLYLSWYAYLRGRSPQRRVWVAASGVSLGLCIATHLLVGGFCAIGLFLQEIALGWRQRRRWSTLAVIALVGAVVASPWLGHYAYGTTRQPQQIHQHFTVGWDTAAIPGLPSIRVLSPAALYNVLPPPLWLAVLLGGFVSLRRVGVFARLGVGVGERASGPAERYALLGLASGLLLTETPLFSLLRSAFGSWSARFLLVAPFSLLFGLGVARLLDYAVGRAAAGRPAIALRAIATGLLVWIAFAGVSSLQQIVARHWGLGQEILAAGPLGGWDLQARLARSGPLPSVVLSDPETAYLLPYLTGVHVAAITPAHGSVHVDHWRRVTEIERFFSPQCPDANVHDILARYGVDAVAIAPSRNWPTPGAGEALLKRLRRMQGFVDTGCCGAIVFLRYERPKHWPAPRPSGAGPAERP